MAVHKITMAEREKGKEEPGYDLTAPVAAGALEGH